MSKQELKEKVQTLLKSIVDKGYTELEQANRRLKINAYKTKKERKKAIEYKRNIKELDRITKKLKIDEQTPLGIAKAEKEAAIAIERAKNQKSFFAKTASVFNGIGKVLAYLPNQAFKTLRTALIAGGIVTAGALIADKDIDDAIDFFEKHDGVVGVTQKLSSKTDTLIEKMKLEEAVEPTTDALRDIFVEPITSRMDDIRAGENCTVEDYRQPRGSIHEFNQKSCQWEFDENAFEKLQICPPDCPDTIEVIVDPTQPSNEP